MILSFEKEIKESKLIYFFFSFDFTGKLCAINSFTEYEKINFNSNSWSIELLVSIDHFWKYVNLFWK
jgi:hypothetical protein